MGDTSPKKTVKFQPAPGSQPVPVLANHAQTVGSKDYVTLNSYAELLDHARRLADSAPPGLLVGVPAVRTEIPLVTQTDSEADRYSAARYVLGVLGDEALQDGTDITVNGRSLSPELVAVACERRIGRVV